MALRDLINANGSRGFDQLCHHALQLPEIWIMNAALLKVRDRVQQILGTSTPMSAGLGKDRRRFRQGMAAIAWPFAVDDKGDRTLGSG